MYIESRRVYLIEYLTDEVIVRIINSIIFPLSNACTHMYLNGQFDPM